MRRYSRPPTILLRVTGLENTLCAALDQQDLAYRTRTWSSLRATLFPDVVIQLLVAGSPDDLALKLSSAISVAKATIRQTRPLHFADVVFLERPTGEEINIIDCSPEEIVTLIATIIDT